MVDVPGPLRDKLIDGFTPIHLLSTGAMVRDFASSRLMWFEQLGWGYYPVRNPVYDQAYFDRYAELAGTKLGRALTGARCNLVHRYASHADCGEVLDVGIGCGAFIEDMGLYAGYDAYGYDINPAAIAWLTDGRGAFRDLYAERFECVTFWDSLEHIADPRVALHQCRRLVFASLPIFRDATHALASKHFRPDEHYHYWTRDGFCGFAGSQGFDVVDITATESALGREDIETFVLRRRGS